MHHRYANGQNGNERTPHLKIQLRKAANAETPKTPHHRIRCLGLKEAAGQSDARLEDSL